MSRPVRRKVIFRADGSARIGLGHLIRCQALAEMLADDFDCAFALAEAPAAVAEAVAARFAVYWLRGDFVAAKPGGAAVAAAQQQQPDYVPAAQQEQPDHLATAQQQQPVYMPAAQQQQPDYVPAAQQEADALASLASPDDIIVLDGYPFDTAYQQRLRACGCKLVSIDDIHAYPFVVDAIINTAGGIRPADYQALPGTRFCLGPRYALLRRPFRLLSGVAAAGTAAAPPTLFICLGGADPHNDSLRVLQRCISLGYFQRYELVLGAAYPWQSVLTDYLRGQSAQVQLHRNLSAEDMAALMQRCPYAVCAPSTIAYEYAAIGGVLYLQQTADNQQDMRAYLLAAGLARDFARDFCPPAGDAAEQALRQRQRQTFDGRQAARLRRLFHGLHISLRPATAADCRQYFDWANDPAVRQQSYNSDPIPYEQHQRWFAAKLADPAETLYLLSYDNQPLGQVRFSTAGEEAVISYALAAPFRGRGLAAPMLERAIAQLATERPALRRLLGYVKNSNEASGRVFAALDFFGSPTELYPDSRVFIASLDGGAIAGLQ